MKLFSFNPSRSNTGSPAADPAVTNARATPPSGSSRTSAASQQRYTTSKDAHRQHTARGRITTFVSKLFGRNPARNPSRAAAFNQGPHPTPTASPPRRNALPQAPSSAFRPSPPTRSANPVSSPARGPGDGGARLGGDAPRDAEDLYNNLVVPANGTTAPVGRDVGGPTADGDAPVAPLYGTAIPVGQASDRTVQGPPGADRTAQPRQDRAVRAPDPHGRLVVGDKDWAINGQITQLTAGAFNTPSKLPIARSAVTVTESGAESTRAIAKEKVVKPTVDQAHRDYPIQIAVGVTSVNACMIERNVATTIVAKGLGEKTVPTSHAGMLNLPTSSGRTEAKPVLAMSLAKGREAHEVLKDHPGLINNPDFQRQMANIEFTAYLTGNPDNHMRNYMIDVDPNAGPIDEAPVKVTMIDNDMSFGGKMLNPDQPPAIQGGLYRHTGLPAYIDAKTCVAIKAMNRDEIAAKLHFLSPDEVSAFNERFDRLLAHVAFLEENNRVVSDWKSFTNAEGAKVAGDSYFKGTLEMSGVYQGGGRVVPRSMILRECQQALGRIDVRASLSAHLSDADRAALDGFADAADLIVPPNGRSNADLSAQQISVSQPSVRPEPVQQARGSQASEQHGSASGGNVASEDDVEYIIV